MKMLLAALASRIIKRGNLEIAFADGARQKFGDGAGPLVAARFTDRRGPLDLVRNPELALGELYMDGRFEMTSGTILDFLRIVMTNAVRKAPPLPMALIWKARHAAAALLRNERAKSRSNVAHHYDLDGRIYDLFLDRDRQYLCGALVPCDRHRHFRDRVSVLLARNQGPRHSRIAARKIRLIDAFQLL